MKPTDPNTGNHASRPDDEIRMASEAGDPRPQPSRLIELFQVSHLRLQSAHYTIFDGRFLSIHQKRPWKKAKRYWVDLGFLDPTPHLLSVTDWRSLYIAGGLAISVSFMIVLSIFTTTPWLQQPWLPVTVVLGCATLVALGLFSLRSRNLVRLHSVSGDAVFLEMANNAPSRGEFTAFLRTLIQHVQSAHRHDPRKPYQRLGVELCEHRRLLDNGVLTQNAYDNAREKILRKHRQAHARPAKQLKQAQAAHNEGDVIEVTIENGTWRVSEHKRSA